MDSNASFQEGKFRHLAKDDGVTHISTGVAIHRDGKILMVRRTAADYMGGVFELPGGGVDEGESIAESAIREVKEETGLTVARIITTFEGFDYSTDKKLQVRQVNFLVEVEPGEVVLNPKEHDDFTWVDESNVTKLYMTENMRKCMSDGLSVIHG